MDHLVDWSFASPGHPVWLSDTDEAFVEATITSVKANIVVVTTKAGRKVTVDTDAPKKAATRGRKPSDEPLRLLPRAPQTAEGVENMDDLNPLNEATIVANIETRFRMDLIYTRTGPILIAMNPFKRLSIYSDGMISMYCGRPHGTLPPHCYQEAEDAFQLLRRDGIDQSIIICGESGAGKTETTKKMLHYISTVARGDGTEKKPAALSRADSVLALTLGERMVDSNALTEAFGNAKTVRNNNSSRFGKFTLFSFAKQYRSTISGGRIRTFLLEKSRVAAQPKGERNYHVFYQLLAGAPPDWRTKMHLQPPQSYHYLNTSGCLEANDINDAMGFESTCDAMDKVQICEDDQLSIFQVVAGVLQIGQVDFTALPDGESCEVAALGAKAAAPPVATAAKLLGLDVEALRQALITRVRVVPPKQEPVASPQTAEQARDSRDALAKALYSRLFDYLVHETNEAFDVDPDPAAAFIGILDIFGFEDLNPNGFEQVFINYTNEKLQAIFNDATFRKEVEEYTREQIPFDRHDFPNNQSCLDLIEKKPMGLLPLIDSECLRGAVASDQSLVSKFHRAHQSHMNYAVCGPASGLRHADGTLTHDSEFIIKHYAGPIIYETAGFVDKNKDAVYDHLYDVVSRSSFPLVASLFPPRLNAPTSPGAPSSPKEGGPGKAVGQTVATRFTTSLNELTEVLNRTQSRFVRCVKTNNLLKPQIFDKPSVLRQLKTSGVMAALEIRRAGYPTRVPYSAFVKQFRVFDVSRADGMPSPSDLALAAVGWPKMKEKEPAVAAPVISGSATQASTLARTQSMTQGNGKDRATAARMMTSPHLVGVITPEQYRLGLTKIFFQADVLVTLQTLKDRILLPYAVKIQHWWLRKQERIWEHKLTRAMHMVTSSVDRATIHGVQNVSRVRRALEAAISAVRYAKGLGMMEPEIFRPALDRALTAAAAAREAVDTAAALKQHEARQRAQQLGDLDSGRARLGRIQEGCSMLTIDKAELQASVAKAGKAIEACREELLVAASRTVVVSPFNSNQGGAALDVAAITAGAAGAPMGRRGSVMQRTFTRAAMLIEQSQGEVAAAVEPAQPEEVDLERREQTCEQALKLVVAAEDLYAQLRASQDHLECARSAGHDALQKAHDTASVARHVASAAGISEVAAVVAASHAFDAAEKDALKALEGVVEASFQLAVETAQETATRLTQVAAREKAQKEEDDRREEGRATLRAACAKQAATYDDAVALGVQERKGMLAAIAAYEAKLGEARLAEVGSASAFIEAADATLAAADAVEVALAAERQHKEACDRVRQTELARLEPPIAALASLEIRAADAGVAEEPTVVGAIADARTALESVRRDIERAEDAGSQSLSAAIMAALSMAVAAERAFAEAKQRKDALDREGAAAARELAALEARLSELRVAAAEDPEAGAALLSVTDTPSAAAAAAIAEARRCVRKGDCARDMHALTLTAATKVKEAEELFSQCRLRAAAMLRRRAAAQAKLRSSAEVLQAARSSLVAANLQERTHEEVHTAMEAADASLHAAQQRVMRPLVANMVQADNGGADEEAAAAEAARKVEAAEAAAACAVSAAERLAREWRTVAAALSTAMERYSAMTAAALRAEVSGDARVVAALEAAEAAAAEANAAVSVGSSASADPAAARHLVDTFGGRLTALDATTTSAQRAKEAADRQRSAAKATLDVAATRLQGATAAATAAGPTAAGLCRATLDAANEAVASAVWMLRRAAEGEAAAGSPEAVTAAAATALGKVAQAEQYVQRTVQRAAQAQGRRRAAAARLEEICAALAEAEDKARGIVVVAVMGAAAGTIPEEAANMLEDARIAVAAAKHLADDGQGQSDDMVADAAAAERAVNAASKAVLEAAEAVDAAAVRHARAGRVVTELSADLDVLVARHATASTASAAEGSMVAAMAAGEEGAAELAKMLHHSPRFAEAAAAVEAQIEVVQTAIATAAAAAAAVESPTNAGGSTAAAAADTIRVLREKVQEEENVGAEERQRAVRRQAQAKRATKELPALQRRLEAAKTTARSPACASLGNAGIETEELSKAEATLEALAKMAALGHHASEEECVSVETATAVVTAAEAAVNRHLGRAQRADSARRAALLRLETCQAHFNEMALAAAAFTARCENVPAAAALEAEHADITHWRAIVLNEDGGAAAAAAHKRSSSGGGSALGGAVSSGALIAQAVAATEAAMALARQRANAPLTAWLEDSASGPAAASTADKAQSLVTAANALVQREAHRLEALTAQRSAAQAALAACADRLMGASAAADAGGVAAVERVAGVLKAAEGAIAGAHEVLNASGGAAAMPALDDAQRAVAAAEAAVAKEARKREAAAAGRRQACVEIKLARDRLDAARAQSAALGHDETEAITTVATKAVELLQAAMAAVSEADDAAAATAGAAPVPKSVGEALRAAEEAEAVLTAHNTKQREAARREALKAAAMRINARRAAEEERAAADEALRQRRRLQDDLERVSLRLNLAMPVVDEMTTAATQATAAVDAARQLVSSEHIDIKTMNVPAAAAALQGALEQVDGLEATVRSMEAAQLAGTAAPTEKAAAPPAAEAYMSRTAAAFEALTTNMQFLTQSMVSMQQVIQHQSRVMQLQGQLLSGAGDRDALLRELAAIHSAQPGAVAATQPDALLAKAGGIDARIIGGAYSAA